MFWQPPPFCIRRVKTERPHCRTQLHWFLFNIIHYKFRPFGYRQVYHVTKPLWRTFNYRAISKRKTILGQALRAAGASASYTSGQSTHEGCKVVSPTHRPPLPPQEIFLVLISVTSLADSRTKELCLRKIPLSPWEIEPATFRLVAHSLTQLHHRVSQLQE